GKHGLSLRLDGLEEGINDNARQRAIVIHSAKYASQSFIKKYGRLGRSFGCPSIPEDDYKETIDLIKEGALLFIYYPDPEYFKGSKIIKAS
ncbi:MAG: murein L,D-transpeptidase catalytic domain-containing protein, partial [Bacteroidota bacterium]